MHLRSPYRLAVAGRKVLGAPASLRHVAPESGPRREAAVAVSRVLPDRSSCRGHVGLPFVYRRVAPTLYDLLPAPMLSSHPL